MFDLAKDQTTFNERAILRKLRVWIIALAAACLLAGVESEQCFLGGRR